MRTDLSGWPTKQQAAQIIGVSTKTLEKLVKHGKIQQREEKRVGKPSIVKLHPDDVERERKERNPEGEPFVLPPEEPEGVALAAAEPSQSSQNGALQLLATAMASAFSDRSQASRDVGGMLRLSEASEYSQIPVGLLRKLLKAGDLRSITYKREVWIRRADLDAL